MFTSPNENLLDRGFRLVAKCTDWLQSHISSLSLSEPGIYKVRLLTFFDSLTKSTFTRAQYYFFTRVVQN